MSIDTLLNEPDSSTVETQNQPTDVVISDPPQVDNATGAPTVPEGNGSHVPLSALEAERKTRQDWKERAVKAETELEHARRQPQQPPQQLDPLQVVQQQIINERFNTSEMLVKQKHEDADDVVKVFMDAARANPALAAQLQVQQHPWQFAYNEGKRLQMVAEMGSDPGAYRAKIEAEIRAKIQSESGGQPQVNLPASLNGARSVAPRSAPAWTGPTPINDLFK